MVYIQIIQHSKVKQNVQFQVGIYMYDKNFHLIKFKMADLRPLSTSIYIITGKPCQIARQLLLKKNVLFQAGIYREKCQLDHIQDGGPVATFYFNMFDN